MENKSVAEIDSYELIWTIVNFGHGSKVLKIAKHNGIEGGTILLGMGTIKNRLLEFFELTDIRKEIVIMAAKKSIVSSVINSLDKEIEFAKPYHGIAFTMPLSLLLTSKNKEYVYNNCEGNNMHNSIFVVVEKDKAELVLDAANKVGARGGTVIRGRGASAFEAGKIFSLDIEPEKDIVLILSEASSTQKIVEAIRDDLEIDKPGNGVIFCQEVSGTYGLFSK